MTASRVLKIAAILLLTAAPAYSQNNAQAPEPPQPDGATYHYAKAHEIAGQDPYLLKWIDQGIMCRSPRLHNTMISALRTPEAEKPAPAVKLADNLFMFGTTYVKTLVVKTSDGLVLIDSLNNPEEARTLVEEQMAKFGLKPADVKFVIVTHGHGDHWGGAKYWQDKYHAKVALLAEDWALIDGTTNGKWMALGKPAHDMTLTDGQDFVLGDTTLHIIKTPGHTPGVASMILPVKENGKTRYIDLWGGTAYNDVLNQHNSLHKLWAVGKTYHAEGMINTHAFVNNIDDQVRDGTLLMGEAKLDKLLGIMDECSEAYLSWQAVEKK